MIPFLIPFLSPLNLLSLQVTSKMPGQLRMLGSYLKEKRGNIRNTLQKTAQRTKFYVEDKQTHLSLRVKFLGILLT